MHAGKKIEQVEENTQRDYFMEAKAYGVIDQIMTKNDLGAAT